MEYTLNSSCNKEKIRKIDDNIMKLFKKKMIKVKKESSLARFHAIGCEIAMELNLRVRVDQITQGLIFSTQEI